MSQGERKVEVTLLVQAGHEQSFKNGLFFKNASFRSYGYAAKSAIFFYTCEHAHTGTRPGAHVVCSLLERRAVVPTMRLRVYSGRFVIFSNLNSMEV